MDCRCLCHPALYNFGLSPSCLKPIPIMAVLQSLASCKGPVDAVSVFAPDAVDMQCNYTLAPSTSLTVVSTSYRIVVALDLSSSSLSVVRKLSFYVNT